MPEDFDFLAADVALEVFVVVVHDFGFVVARDFDFLVLVEVHDFVEVLGSDFVVDHDFDFPDHLAAVRGFVVVALFVVAAVRGFDFPDLVEAHVNRFFYRYLFPDLFCVYRFFLSSLN